MYSRLSTTEKHKYLEDNCTSVEKVPIGWFVNNKFYITPHGLWRPKGKPGKIWYHYKSIEDLVLNYVNKG